MLYIIDMCINSNLFIVICFRASLNPVKWEAKKEDNVRDLGSGLSPANCFLHDSG